MTDKTEQMATMLEIVPMMDDLSMAAFRALREQKDRNWPDWAQTASLLECLERSSVVGTKVQRAMKVAVAEFMQNRAAKQGTPEAPGRQITKEMWEQSVAAANASLDAKAETEERDARTEQGGTP